MNESVTNKLVSGEVVAQTSDTSSEAGSLSSEDGSISSENSDGATSEYNNPQGCKYLIYIILYIKYVIIIR